MKSINKLSIANLLYALLIIPTILICAASCKKDNTPTPTPTPVIPPPVINTINPNHGPFNTTVTITGINFSSNASENIVKFNGKVATVTNATTTLLTVIVPVNAGTGNVSVMVNSSTASGSVFTYDYTGVVTTIAGSPSDGIFQYPSGVAVDDQDNIYVADMVANQVKKISPAGAVTVLAGNGAPGFLDGTGTTAKFNYPWALKCDAQGNVYVTDMYNHSIRKVTAAGVVTTIAGNGTPGYVEGQGAVARFDHPTGLTFDAGGILYIADSYNGRIRKITSAGMVSTVVFNINSTQPAASHGLIVNAAGTIYGCEQGNHRIMKFLTDGSWSEIGYGFPGFIDGPSNYARFNGPTDIIPDGLGNIYVVDAANGAIRKIAADGYISTIAGNGTLGYADGTGSAARFYSPAGIAIDKQGNLIIADATNHAIRKVVIQ